MEPTVRVAWRFAMFRDLPEHPLFAQILARLAAGYSPWRVASWLQETVPSEDPFSSARIDRRALYRKLKRFRNLLPPAVMLPSSYLDDLTRKVDIHVDVVPRLAALILFQERRLSQFAAREKDSPLGTTVDQGRKEVLAMADLLAMMRDTQIALGLLPGSLIPRLSMRQSTVAISASEFDLPATDPFNRFLERNPSAIATVMAAIDSAMNQVSDTAPDVPDRPAVPWRNPGSPLSQRNQ